MLSNNPKTKCLKTTSIYLSYSWVCRLATMVLLWFKFGLCLILRPGREEEQLPEECPSNGWGHKPSEVWAGTQKVPWSFGSKLILNFCLHSVGQSQPTRSDETSVWCVHLPHESDERRASLLVIIHRTQRPVPLFRAVFPHIRNVTSLCLPIIEGKEPG